MKHDSKREKSINEQLTEFVHKHSGSPPPEKDVKLTHEQAMEIFEQIGKNKSGPAGRALVDAAIGYARLRVDHLLASGPAQQQVDSERSAAHDAFIAACDYLAEQMAADGQDISWRVSLTQNRKTIGDFACYIHFILGIWAR